jgi:hypothetical protein
LELTPATFQLALNAAGVPSSLHLKTPSHWAALAQEAMAGFSAPVHMAEELPAKFTVNFSAKDAAQVFTKEVADVLVLLGVRELSQVHPAGVAALEGLEEALGVDHLPGVAGAVAEETVGGGLGLVHALAR